MGNDRVRGQDLIPICSDCRAWVLRQCNHHTLILSGWQQSNLETWNGTVERGHWMDVPVKDQKRLRLWLEVAWDWKQEKDNKLCLDSWSSEWLERKLQGPQTISEKARGQGLRGNRCRVASLGIRICWYCAQENQAACEQTRQESSWLPGWALIKLIRKKN